MLLVSVGILTRADTGHRKGGCSEFQETNFANDSRNDHALDFSLPTALFLEVKYQTMSIYFIVENRFNHSPFPVKLYFRMQVPEIAGRKFFNIYSLYIMYFHLLLVLIKRTRGFTYTCTTCVGKICCSKRTVCVATITIIFLQYKIHYKKK